MLVHLEWEMIWTASWSRVNLDRPCLHSIADQHCFVDVPREDTTLLFVTCIIVALIFLYNIIGLIGWKGIFSTLLKKHPVTTVRSHNQIWNNAKIQHFGTIQIVWSFWRIHAWSIKSIWNHEYIFDYNTFEWCTKS